MTQPTQAQIEAAAEAMMRDMFAPHELPLDDELRRKYLHTATAALTAALFGSACSSADGKKGVEGAAMIKVDHMSLGSANAQIERLLAALQQIADDPDTNSEAAAFARNFIADEVAYLKHQNEP